jgi:hypothetical protein
MKQTVKEKIESRISLNEWCLLNPKAQSTIIDLIRDENKFLKELLNDLYAE